MKNLSLVFFTFFIFTGACAQYKNLKAKGDKAFQNKNYYEAAYYYNKLITDKDSAQKNIPFYASASKGEIKAGRSYILYQLAESYRLYQDYEKAAGWYNKVLRVDTVPDYPLTALWYGVCLRANKNLDEAVRQLQQFKSVYKGESQYIDLANKELANCAFAKEQYRLQALVNVKKMGGQWNTGGGNYSLVKNGGTYWFTSSRLTTGDKKNLNHLYTVSDPAASGPAIFPVAFGDKKIVEYGTPSFDAKHDRLYLAARYEDADVTYTAIYYCAFENNKWSAPQKLNDNVNTDGYNAIQPFVQADGKRLYFASDKPGGMGGYDIWVSNLDNEGNAVDAVNMGKTINSASDEQAPFYDAVHQRLMFSSTGFTGLGGFDVFASNQINGKWTAPVNMGYPINSSKDDLYYFADPDDSHKFYISSDRESTCCLNLFEVHYKTVSIAGAVMDCDSNKTLSGVKVSLLDSASGKPLKNTATGSGPRYAFDNLESGTYKLLFEKEGYFNKVIYFSAKAGQDTLLTRDLCVQAFKVNKPIVIKNILYDFNKATLRPESKKALDAVVSILIDNPTIRIELSSHTDSIGSAVYNIKLSQSRAQSCVDYILSKGIYKATIVAVGYGKSRPVAPNSLPNGQDDPDGRQLNRRTEFTVKQ